MSLLLFGPKTNHYCSSNYCKKQKAEPRPSLQGILGKERGRGTKRFLGFGSHISLGSGWKVLLAMKGTGLLVVHGNTGFLAKLGLMSSLVEAHIFCSWVAGSGLSPSITPKAWSFFYLRIYTRICNSDTNHNRNHISNNWQVWWPV